MTPQALAALAGADVWLHAGWCTGWTGTRAEPWSWREAENAATRLSHAFRQASAALACERAAAPPADQEVAGTGSGNFSD